MVLECFAGVTGFDGSLVVLRSPIFVQKSVDFRAPIVSSGRVRPTHFAGDDFVALGVVDVLLQQIHVLFRSLVLLLEEPFPIVLVPDPVLFPIEVGHTGTKRHLGEVRKRFPAVYETADCTSRLVCNRSCPQAASMSWPFSRRRVAATSFWRTMERKSSCCSGEGRDHGSP